MEATGIEIDGQPSDRVFDDVVDFDATSLYPSIILATNIDSAGQVGRIVLLQEDGTFIDGATLVESWTSGDMVEVGRDWLNLPGLYELLHHVVDQ